MIQPPTVGPSVGASEARQPMVAAATVILGPGKKAKAAVNTVGIIEPPRKPCSARKAIMLSMFQAQPHSRLVDGEAGGRGAEQPAGRTSPATASPRAG